MRRASIISLLVGVSLVAVVSWIASQTYWADTRVPVPPRGEALVNPFYAVQRFAEALGARTAWDRVLAIPPADSVIVLSDWHWSLNKSRRETLERWVESGGRLVVDGRLAGGQDEFELWSGIAREHRELNDPQKSAGPTRDETCRKFQEERDGPPGGEPDARHWMCDLDGGSSLSIDRHARWALRDASSIRALRLKVGRGSVTDINATPFRNRHLFDGDHGWLFVTSTQMGRGDDVHFLSEGAQPSLLVLLWQRGGPVVVLTLALISLVLWRAGVRFGPLAAAQPAARRSLAEQIRGTGQFALRHGGGDSLLAAASRALDEAARRRIPGYTRCPPKDAPPHWRA
jgi:hypothetical protein